jgi:anti-sigma regulatory factor (Ser/Thr protein kinase)
MSGAVEEFVVELAGGVHAAAAARRVVTDRGPDLAEPLRGDVLLLVTELVTNAVRHGRVGTDGSVRLECRSAGERVRFLVTDAGTSLLGNGGPPAAQRTINGDHPSGWGLHLVEEIAEQWGVQAAPLGTCVWFEVAAQ